MLWQSEGWGVRCVAACYHLLEIIDDLGYGDSEVRGRNPGDMGDSLPSVELGQGRSAVQVAVGHTHTCVLLDNGEVKCIGDGSSGQVRKLFVNSS